MHLKEKAEQIINKQSEMIDLLLEKNNLLVEMNTELKNRIQILNKKNKPITITAMGLLVSWQIKWQNA